MCNVCSVLPCPDLSFRDTSLLLYFHSPHPHKILDRGSGTGEAKEWKLLVVDAVPRTAGCNWI